MGTFIVLGIVGIWLFVAVRYSLKNKGCGGSCSGCGKTCPAKSIQKYVKEKSV